MKLQKKIVRKFNRAFRALVQTLNRPLFAHKRKSSRRNPARRTVIAQPDVRAALLDTQSVLEAA
jgi:hypothetical protein